MAPIKFLCLFALIAFVVCEANDVGFFVAVNHYKQAYREFPLVIQVQKVTACFGLWNMYDYDATVTLQNMNTGTNVTYTIDRARCAPWGFISGDTWVCPTHEVPTGLSTSDNYQVHLNHDITSESCAYIPVSFQFIDPTWSRDLHFELSASNTYMYGQQFLITNIGGGSTPTKLYGRKTFVVTNAGYSVAVDSPRNCGYWYEVEDGGVDQTACYYMDPALSGGPYNVMNYKVTSGEYYNQGKDAATTSFSYTSCDLATDCQNNACGTAISDWNCTLSDYGRKYCIDQNAINNTRCFVATAAYGTEFDSKVSTLRSFRDTVLGESVLGMYLVKLYYSYGPYLAKYIEDSEAKRFVARMILYPIVWSIENPIGMISTLISIPLIAMLANSYFRRIRA